MDPVFVFTADFRWEKAEHRLCVRVQRIIGLLAAQRLQPDFDIADAQFLLRKKQRRLADRLPAHPRAIRTAEVFDQPFVIVQREQRVTPRYIL